MGVLLLLHILLLLFAIPRGILCHSQHGDGEQNAKMNAHTSCSDLMNLWQNMHRITRHSLTTNEIPVFPRGFVEFARRISTPTSKMLDQKLSPYINQIPFVNHDDPPNVFFKNSRENDLLDRLSDDLLEEDDVKGLVRNENHPRSFGMFLIPQKNQMRQKQTLNPQFLHEQFSRIQTGHQLNPEFDILRFTPNRPKVHHVAHPKLHPMLSISPGGNLLVDFEGLRSKSPPESMVHSPVINEEESDTKQTPNFGEHSEFYGPSKPATNFNADDSFMGMFGTVVHDTNQKDESKLFDSPAQWDDVERFGSFGRFAADNQEDANGVSVDVLPSSRQTSDVQTPLIGATWFLSPDDKGTRGESSGDLVQKISCLEADGLPCTIDSHCACVGWVPLRCTVGKCSVNGPQNLDLDYGKWHDGPLPFSQLGISRTRRSRKKKPTLM